MTPTDIKLHKKTALLELTYSDGGIYSLPAEFRAAVVLCDIEGLSYEEIGATLGVKLGTVRSRIHRGRQALRDHLAARSVDRKAVVDSA
jgi:DNA-directed RNA polymerase specialized sigma24 family protein